MHPFGKPATSQNFSTDFFFQGLTRFDPAQNNCLDSVSSHFMTSCDTLGGFPFALCVGHLSKRPCKKARTGSEAGDADRDGEAAGVVRGGAPQTPQRTWDPVVGYVSGSGETSFGGISLIGASGTRQPFSLVALTHGVPSGGDRSGDRSGDCGGVEGSGAGVGSAIAGVGMGLGGKSVCAAPSYDPRCARALVMEHLEEQQVDGDGAARGVTPDMTPDQCQQAAAKFVTPVGQGIGKPGAAAVCRGTLAPKAGLRDARPLLGMHPLAHQRPETLAVAAAAAAASTAAIAAAKLMAAAAATAASKMNPRGAGCLARPLASRPGVAAVKSGADAGAIAMAGVAPSAASAAAGAVGFACSKSAFVAVPVAARVGEASASPAASGLATRLDANAADASRVPPSNPVEDGMFSAKTVFVVGPGEVVYTRPKVNGGPIVLKIALDRRSAEAVRDRLAACVPMKLGLHVGRRFRTKEVFEAVEGALKGSISLMVKCRDLSAIRCDVDGTGSEVPPVSFELAPDVVNSWVRGSGLFRALADLPGMWECVSVKSSCTGGGEGPSIPPPPSLTLLANRSKLPLSSGWGYFKFVFVVRVLETVAVSSQFMSCVRPCS